MFIATQLKIMIYRGEGVVSNFECTMFTVDISMCLYERVRAFIYACVNMWAYECLYEYYE